MQGAGLIGLAPKKLDDKSDLLTSSLKVQKFHINYPIGNVILNKSSSNPIGKHKIYPNSKYWELPLKSAFYGNNSIINN